MLVAIGAILALAVDVQAQGININMVGVILLLVGIVGLLYSSLFLASYAPFRTHSETVMREPGMHDHASGEVVTRETRTREHY
jgi:hypothetical protein